jgi:alginate O-acetyltransferase complex protein AlgI
MIPSDPRYLLFLAAVATCFHLLPGRRSRQLLLLGAGYGFYACFEARYVLILLGVSAASFLGARGVQRATSDAGRQRVFTAAVLATLAPLVLFKYYDFLAGIAADLAGASWAPPRLGLTLPVGLSFYTFAALGYLIDVFVGTLDAERRPLRHALFLGFFPTLVAGPIERARNLGPQLDLERPFTDASGTRGMRELLTGLFMKIALADTLAPVADAVYASPRAFGAVDHVLAVVFFSFQVYADFAGYSLIALGSARLLGVELLPNFEQPYLSASVPEFWRRWHISLSGWVRDYVFTPLRLRWRTWGTAGVVLALVVTFMIVGLWHGAAWGYVLFGLVHGIYMSVATFTRKGRDRAWARTGFPPGLVHGLRVLLTFALVALSFVLFRAASPSDAAWIYARLLDPSAWGVPTLAWKVPVLAVAVIVAGDLAARRGLGLELLPRPARWLAYNAAATSIAALVFLRFLSSGNQARPFVYVQF